MKLAVLYWPLLSQISPLWLGITNLNLYNYLYMCLGFISHPSFVLFFCFFFLFVSPSLQNGKIEVLHYLRELVRITYCNGKTPMGQTKPNQTKPNQTKPNRLQDCFFRPNGSFSKGINELPMRCLKCIDKNGSYFDQINI